MAKCHLRALPDTMGSVISFIKSLLSFYLTALIFSTIFFILDVGNREVKGVKKRQTNANRYWRLGVGGVKYIKKFAEWVDL